MQPRAPALKFEQLWMPRLIAIARIYMGHDIQEFFFEVYKVAHIETVIINVITDDLWIEPLLF